MSSNKDPDNIYVNARINYIELPNITSPAIYDVTKTNPIINNPREYYCSVISFSIPFNTIPITIAPIKMDQLPPINPNLMTCEFGIEIPSISYSESQNCIYIPSRSDLKPPQQNKPTQIITEYYYIYSFTALLNIFNNTLSNLWNGAVIANPSLNLGTQPPYFILDENTQLINLIISNEFLNLCLISINSDTLSFLEGFNYNNVVYKNNIANAAYFNFYTEGNQCNLNGGEKKIPGNGYWYYSQEFNNLDLWYSIRKVFITTTSIPINQEIITINDENGKQSGLTSYYPILFDYTPQITNNKAGKSVNYFEPSAQYKLVDLNSDQPLYRIDLSLFWQDKLGNNYQIYISKNQSINIKLGFFKKSLYKNYWPNLIR